MIIYKSYKTELKVNKTEIRMLKQHCGAARFAYNWFLNEKSIIYFNNRQNNNKQKLPSLFDLKKVFTKLKQTIFSDWAYNISSCAFEEAMHDCEYAFEEHFRKCKDPKIKDKGYPKFKSKRNLKESFTLRGTTIQVLSGGRIKLPKIGIVKLFQKDYFPITKLNPQIKICSVTISTKANKWFISLETKQEIAETKIVKPINEVVGVDLGINFLAVTSNGEKFNNPKALKKYLKKLRRLQRKLSRQQFESKNYGKTRQKIKKLHYRISNIRKDNIHKITTKIVNENQVIVLEGMSIKNMLKHNTLAQSISDASFYEFRRQIEYKAKMKGRLVIVADRFFPSSKLCSSCSVKNKDLKQKDRTFICINCNLSIDRDLNASKNLFNYYNNLEENTGGLSEIQASESVKAQISLPVEDVKEEFNVII